MVITLNMSMTFVEVDNFLAILGRRIRPTHLEDQYRGAAATVQSGSMMNEDRLYINFWNGIWGEIITRTERDESITTRQPPPPSSIIKFSPTCQNHTCAICLCDFEDDDNTSVISCNHNFHVDCINTWFESRDTCPICREKPYP